MELYSLPGKNIIGKNKAVILMPQRIIRKLTKKFTILITFLSFESKREMKFFLGMIILLATFSKNTCSSNVTAFKGKVDLLGKMQQMILIPYKVISKKYSKISNILPSLQEGLTFCPVPNTLMIWSTK